MERKPKKLMKDYGYKTIGFYLLDPEYEAMRKFCFDKRLSHTGFLREMVINRLIKEGYLKKESKAQ